jgi:uncharacterized membrane protein (UPF0127 family)
MFWLSAGAIVLLLSLTIIAGGLVWVFRGTDQTCAISIPRPEASRAAFADTYSPSDCVSLWQAKTPQQRTQGLSDKKNLAPTQGMLFTFDEPGKQCMWMKDMYVSLDMIWLNEKKAITKIERNITPETFPESFCGTSSDKYVIELLNGTASLAGLQVGDTLNL